MAEVSAETLTFLDSILASSPDAILIVAADQKVIAYNRRFMELWELPEGARVADNSELVDLALKKMAEPDRFLTDLKESWSDPNRAFSHSIQLRSGRILEYDSVPWIFRSEYRGRVITFKDSTARRHAEERLRLSETRLRTIFEQAPCGMTLFDMKGDFIASNPAFCKMIGYTEDELKTIGILGISDPREFTKGNKELLKDMALGKIDLFELDKNYIRKDGRVIQGHLVASTVRDSSGVARYGIGMISDVTQERQVELALRKSEEKFRSIFETAAMGIAILSLDGKILTANAACQKILGYTEEELQRTSIKDLSHQDDFPGCYQVFLDMAAGKMSTSTMEKRYIRKDGRMIWAKLIEALGRDTEGKPSYVVAMLQEVTREKEVEESLRQNREYLANVLAYSPVIVGAIDVNGIIRLSEGKGLEAQGLKPGELIGQSIYELLKGDPESIKNIHRVLSGESFVSLLKDHRSDLCWETRWSPVNDAHGKVQGAIAVSLNVTERERLANHRESLFHQEQIANEAARQAIRDRDEFMAIASHELRTPITPLKMQLQFLIRQLSTGKFSSIPEAADVLKIIQISEQQLDRLTRLIEDMLHASRMSATHLSLSHETMDLTELVLQVVDRYRLEATRAGCQVVLKVERNLMGQWDRFRIDQVIVNLMTNAIKYGAGHPIEVTVSRRDSMARLEIRDHGIGIESKYHARIFEQFQRVASIHAYGGFGLGLYIARQIVSAHGGNIEVQSSLGEGARFIVELPLEGMRK